MHAAGEILVRLQRDGKRQHQGRGAIQLHLRGVEERQRFTLAFSASAASWARSGFAVAAGAGAEACGVPLSSHPVNENAVRSASDSAAKRNGFILLTPRPMSLMQFVTFIMRYGGASQQ